MEARAIGDAAYRLARLRFLLREAEKSGGSIVVGGGLKSQPVQLGSIELQAALALLIERSELFLASFNVQIERSNA